MKKTIILLFILLPLLSDYLFAQSQEGLFRLKEGDWFEVQVNEPDGSEYLLRYQYQRKLSDNNQQFSISFEHYKIKWQPPKPEKIHGYDSYYPKFEENKTFPDRQIYTLIVTPVGKILSLSPDKGNKSSVISLTNVGSSFRDVYSTTYQQSMDDSIRIITFSGLFMIPVSKSEFKTNKNITRGVNLATIKTEDSVQTSITYLKESGLPLSCRLPDLQYFVTKASFPLPENTLIQGKIEDQINQNIRISLNDGTLDINFPDTSYYFGERNYKTDRKGSFSCPIFLNRPLHLKIQIGNKIFTTFLEPADTLTIESPGNQNQLHFEGKAGLNTQFSNEIDCYRIHFPYKEGIQDFMNHYQKAADEVNVLLNKYKDNASENCLEYFRKDWTYFLAAEKLHYDENSKKLFSIELNNFGKMKRSSLASKFPQVIYPADFFLEVDTLPLLMNPFEWNSSYQDYISISQHFKQRRLGSPVGKLISGNFLEDYYFSQASLQGYPLYFQIEKSIEQEIRKGLSENDFIESYYNDFINNCSDPALAEPLKDVHDAALKLKIGNRFPIESFSLKDSSIFNLNQFKGKVICFILLDRSKSAVNGYLNEINKFKPDDVEFIIARLSFNKWKEGELDSTIFGKPNVTYIELGDKNIVHQLLGTNKIFMLDKWFRIVENNAEDPLYHKYNGGISGFEKALRKTIEAKRYSKEEKASAYKIAGWSFGSILFTFLIGLWIYKIRIRKIKQQEDIKRRIKELEIKAIRSQMNPHFVFNALNSIQSLINGNQFKEANIYLSKFAVLLRGVLNNSEKSTVSLSDELRSVELYCQLEQLRFEFEFNIKINPEVNCDLIEIPGMIIQPLAENAIVHGLSPKGKQGKLSIQIERHNGDLCVGVSDNGVGLSPQTKDTLSQKGFGLKLVEERLHILNLDGKMAKLTIQNKDNESGTFAKLTIPIE